MAYLHPALRPVRKSLSIMCERGGFYIERRSGSRPWKIVARRDGSIRSSHETSDDAEMALARLRVH